MSELECEDGARGELREFDVPIGFAVDICEFGLRRLQMLSNLNREAIVADYCRFRI